MMLMRSATAGHNAADAACCVRHAAFTYGLSRDADAGAADVAADAYASLRCLPPPPPCYGLMFDAMLRPLIRR